MWYMFANDGVQNLVQRRSRQNSTANMEMNLREIVVRQMSEMKNSLLGVEGNKAGLGQGFAQLGPRISTALEIRRS